MYLGKSFRLFTIILVSSIVIAFSTGCSSSSGGSGLMGLLLGSAKKQVQTPTCSPSGGTYSEDIVVTITSPTDGALIYFTTDGSDPDTSSTQYILPIPVSGNGTVLTIKAIAVKDEMSDSNIMNAEYTIDYEHVSTPQFFPLAGTFDHDIDVTISCLTEDVQIYYTTNGDDPTNLSSLYSTGIPVAGHETNMTIKAIAVKAGMDDSTIASAEYTITYPTVATPTFNPSEGTYDHDISVEITCSEGDVTIYYTTDESNPTTSSDVYSTGIPVAGNGSVMTIKAIAVKSGMVQSEVGSADYEIHYDTVSTPHFNIDTGTYNQNLNINITCPTTGATIYYTTDGSEPDTSSDVFSTAIPVNGHGTVMTIKAFATKSGMLDSTVESKTYTIQYLPVATPTFTTSAGNNSTYLFQSEFIFLNCTTTGVTMYYTTDGSDPTTSSTQYVSSISTTGLDESTTIKAIAVKTGMLDSAVGSRGYAIEQRDIYIVGGIWYTKNLYAFSYLTASSASQANRIVVSGTSVYTAGYYWNGTRRVACYWTNAARTDLPGTVHSEINGLALNGTSVYTAGFHGNQACYWINSTQNLITTSYKSKGNGIALSGSDVYVAGWNQETSANQIACYWINDTKYDLSVPSGTTSSEATDIVISGGHVYIAGQYYNGNNCTCYWVDGVRNDLGTMSAYSTEIAVSGSNVYVAGESSSNACYWTNSVMTGLSRDSAESISVVGSDVYVLESWYVSGPDYYMVLIKNGVEVRVLQASNDYPPTSMYVVP